MSSIQLKIIGVTAATLLIATAIYVSVSYQPQGSLEVDYPTYTVSNFGSYDDFNTFLQASVEAQTNNALSDGSETPSASRTDVSNEENKGSDVASSTEYDASDSGTQSSAVEEADIVKSDGTYLYVISQGSLCIISAYPAEDAELVSTITFEESSTPRNLFINGDNLAVITQSYLYRTLDEEEPFDDVECIWQDTTSTHIILYDISDRENPVKIRDVSLEGYYYTAHMIDEYVYVITTQYTYEPVLYEGAESSYVPRICIDDDVKTIGLSSIYYIDDPGISKTLTHVVSVHISDVSKEVHAEVFLVGDPSVIYVSSDSVYIASSSYLNDYETIQGLLEEYVLPALPSEASHEIDAVDSLTLEEYQKTMVIEWVIQNYVEQMDEQQRQTIAEQLITQLQKTLLHKITLDNGDITYADQGTIPGTINNQDALSEYNGYLYVVTTMNGWVMSSYLSSIESYNNLYVLDETLDVVGSLDHLSNGASVSSVRFVDDTCYLDTYEQDTPLLVIDLSNPDRPEVVGELDMPGYSTYLYPYDDTHILGLRQEDNSIVVSLFDVEDRSKPRELSSYQIEPQTKDEEDYWYYSTALYDHQAFFFDVDEQLLILPVSKGYTESAYVFGVSETGIELQGVLTHASDEGDVTELEEPGIDSYWKGSYGYSIQRSLCIEDVIYTISNAMIKMHDGETLEEINTISLL